MANRNLLPKHWLDDYKAWLEAQGFQTRPGRGAYQALQVKFPDRPQWHSVFYRETRNPHYTVPQPLEAVTIAYINIRRGYADHHSAKGFKASPDIRPNAGKKGPGHPVPFGPSQPVAGKDRYPPEGKRTATGRIIDYRQEGAGDPEEDAGPPF